MDIIFNGYHHSHCSIRPTEETFRADVEEVRKHLCCDLRDIERALQQMVTTYRDFDRASGIGERIYNAKLSAILTRKHLESSGIKQAAISGLTPISTVTVEKPEKITGTTGDEMDVNKREVLEAMDAAITALDVLETKRHRQEASFPENVRMYRLSLQSIYNEMVKTL